MDEFPNSRDYHDRDVYKLRVSPGTDRFQKLDTVHDRHSQIEENNGGKWMGQQVVEGFLTIEGGRDSIAISRISRIIPNKSGSSSTSKIDFTDTLHCLRLFPVALGRMAG